MALPVALQLFTVRERMAIDIEGTLRAVKAMGYSGIEVCNGSYGMDPDEFKALCDSIGLRIISAHVGTGDIIDDTEKTLEFYKKLGVSYLAIAAFWGDYQYKKAGYDEMIKRLDRAGAYFKENGIQILYHNHEWEFKKVDGEYELDLILKDVNDDNLLPQIDVCWATVGHLDAPDYMRRYNGRCPLVHLKDFYCEGDYSYENHAYKRPETLRLRPVGYGRIDMPAVLDTAKEIGAEWVIVEQDVPAFGLGELENAALSREWLKTIGW